MRNKSVTRNKIELANRLHSMLKSWLLTDDLLMYFFTKYPQNNELEIVDLKVRLINNLYYTNLRATAKMAKHICNLGDLDNLIKQGNINAVSKIAHFEVGGKIRNMISFASKYCHFHNHNNFPIYDSYALRALKIITDNKLDDYSSYSNEIFILAKETCSNIREIDRYLWLFGQKIAKNQNKLHSSIKLLFNSNKELVEQL